MHDRKTKPCPPCDVARPCPFTFPECEGRAETVVERMGWRLTFQRDEDYPNGPTIAHRITDDEANAIRDAMARAVFSKKSFIEEMR